MSEESDRQVNCARCGTSRPAYALACPQCHAMVHAARLDELSASARAHEARREFIEARGDWQNSLKLLPPDSTQAEWVRGRIAELNQLVRQQNLGEIPPPESKTSNDWTRRLGPLAPLAAFLLKGKFLLSLFKLKFLFSFASFAVIYWGLYGWKFGLGMALLIMVHEFGHFIAAKRRGFKADLPVFIPFFGAYVRYAAVDILPETRSFISLAGPAAGALGSLVCALIWLNTKDDVWVALAAFNSFINMLNLIPVFSLDGAQAMVSINRAGRIGIAIAAVLFAAYFSQPILLFVALGAAYRAFEKIPSDMPPKYGVTAYFVFLVAFLGFLAGQMERGAPGAGPFS